jgi:hypothetical protein
MYGPPAGVHVVSLESTSGTFAASIKGAIVSVLGVEEPSPESVVVPILLVVVPLSVPVSVVVPISVLVASSANVGTPGKSKERKTVNTVTWRAHPLMRKA